MLSKTTALLGALALLAVIPASAQRSPLEFSVPFDFKVGPTHMTAGTYEVSFPAPAAVMIRSTDCKQKAIVLTHAASPKAILEQGTLQFKRYGDAHFLSQIWSPGYGQGHQLLKSRAEREAEVEYARRSTRGDLVAVKIGR